MVVEPASVRACVRSFTFSKIFFSETAWPIKAKFYVEHLWVGGTKVCVYTPGIYADGYIVFTFPFVRLYVC